MKYYFVFLIVTILITNFHDTYSSAVISTVQATLQDLLDRLEDLIYQLNVVYTNLNNQLSPIATPLYNVIGNLQTSAAQLAGIINGNAGAAVSLPLTVASVTGNLTMAMLELMRLMVNNASIATQGVVNAVSGVTTVIGNSAGSGASVLNGLLRQIYDIVG